MNLSLLIMGALFVLAALLSKKQLRRIALVIGGVYVTGLAFLLPSASQVILLVYALLGLLAAILFSHWHVRKAFQAQSPMFEEARQSAWAFLGAGIVLILVGLTSPILHLKATAGIELAGFFLAVLGLWLYWNVRHFEKQKRPT